MKVIRVVIKTETQYLNLCLADRCLAHVCDRDRAPPITEDLLCRHEPPDEPFRPGRSGRHVRWPACGEGPGRSFVALFRGASGPQCDPGVDIRHGAVRRRRPPASSGEAAFPTDRITKITYCMNKYAPSSLAVRGGTPSF